MFQVVSLIFQGIECFVLDLPAAAATPHQDIGILLGNRKVGHPGEALRLSGLGIVFLVNQEIHFQIRVGLVQRRVVEETVAVHYLRVVRVWFGESGAGAILHGLVQVLEQ